jgi:hypothetical protein
MAPEGAYYLRRAPGADEFRAAWDAALDHGVQTLTDLALERAKEGVPVPVFYKGEVVGEKRWYNDRLLMFLLKHHMPSKYGADLARGTRHPDTIAREAAEAAAAQEKLCAEEEEVIQALTKRLQIFGIRTRRENAQEIRARYEAYAADPAKRAAWELLNEKPLEAMLGPEVEGEFFDD